MKHVVLALALGLGVMTADTAPGLAGGVIESACLKSDRTAANRTLCGCLQAVANAVLSSSHQRQGAEFFRDPHKSQDVRMSKRAADEQFWAHWERFAETSVQHCQ
jgi:hypothetical protein